MLKTVHQKLLHHTRPLLAWLKLLWRRIDEDHMTTLAGNLAYVSLLSLVPLIAVVFALFAAFPMFSEVSVQIRHFIFANFIPATGDVIQGYIEQFVANSSRMTAVGCLWPDRHLAAADVLDRQRAKHHLAQHAQPPQSLFLCRLLDDPDPRSAAGGRQPGDQFLSAVAALGKRPGRRN